MKSNILKFICGFGLVSALFTSCKNGDQTFSDYEGGTTVYFPYQYPVRTIVLGDDEYDLTLDHAHKCKILATFGGSYNGSGGSVTVAQDPNLVNHLTLEDGTPIKVMPESHYELATTTFNFNGTMNGGSEVQLTEAFFADPDAIKNTYVIPLVMTTQSGFGKILTGEVLKDYAGQNVDRTDPDKWNIQPMDYVLYMVKYQNKYTGFWLTHGTTDISNIEKAKIHQIETKSMNTCIYHASYTTNDYWMYKRDKDGNITSETEKTTHTFDFDLLLTFDGGDNCVITMLTPGITGSGTGSWTDNGAVKAWGKKDRDLMELTYNVDFATTDELGNAQKASVHEKLVWQRSGVKKEEFKPVYNK